MPPPERRPSDTPRSYAALVAYCTEGPTRSLEKLVQMWATTGLAKPPTKWLSTLKRWSADYDWQARVQAYDAAIAAEDEAARASIRAARRAELEEMDWEQGALLRQRVAEIAAELPRFMRRSVQRIEKDGQVTEVITVALSAGPGELARALKLASELQRLSVGEPTERTEHTGTFKIYEKTDAFDPDDA